MSSSSSKDYITFYNGYKMPILGLGTWKSKPGEVKEVVIKAAKVGYRHFDCASGYGNEAEIGEALQEVFQDKSLNIKREDLFITSKLWCTMHRKEHVLQSCQKTLKDLKLEYLDLYLIHFPFAFVYSEDWLSRDEKGNIRYDFNVSLQETWEAMEDLVNRGMVKNIGVSNYTLAETMNLMSYAKIKPAVNQIELHPYFAREDLVKEGSRFGLHFTAYSPLGSGREGPLQDPLVNSIAKKYNKTPAQVLLRYCIERGVSTIPKSVREERLKENLNVFDFSLTQEEVASLTKLNRNLRTCDTKEYWGIAIYD